MNLEITDYEYYSDGSQYVFVKNGHKLPLGIYQQMLEYEKFKFHEQNENDNYEQKSEEIQAIRENTKAQKELAETVLSAMTYLAQLLKQSP